MSLLQNSGSRREEARLSKSEIGNFLRNNHRDAKEILCSFPPSLFVQSKTVLHIHQMEKAAAQHGWLSNLTSLEHCYFTAMSSRQSSCCYGLRTSHWRRC